jgi:hypothetical protein
MWLSWKQPYSRLQYEEIENESKEELLPKSYRAKWQTQRYSHYACFVMIHLAIGALWISMTWYLARSSAVSTDQFLLHLEFRTSSLPASHQLNFLGR